MINEPNTKLFSKTEIKRAWYSVVTELEYPVSTWNAHQVVSNFLMILEDYGVTLDERVLILNDIDIYIRAEKRKMDIVNKTFKLLEIED